MKVCRWFGAFLILAGLTVLAVPELPVFAGDKDKKGQDKGKDDKTKTKDDKTKDDKTDKGKTDKGKEDKTAQPAAGDWVWKAFDPKESKDYYQTLTTKTTQKMKVMGMEVTQVQDQTFFIQWSPLPQDDKGNWVVKQRIVGVKMDIDIGGNKISYDSTAGNQPQNPMTDFFKALLELDLKFTIKKDLSQVIKIDGNQEFITKLSKTNPQMEPLLKSILSEDALKKMTEPTLFAFPTPAERTAKTWKRDSKLDLGPIGSYKSDYTFSLAGKEGSNEKIDAKQTLTYVKPSDKNKQLPFVITEGDLNGKDGKGYALFNPAKGRFDHYEMKMKLAGSLTIDIGGMKTTVELEQDQTATVKTQDTDPVAELKKK